MQEDSATKEGEGSLLLVKCGNVQLWNEPERATELNACFSPSSLSFQNPSLFLQTSLAILTH